MRDIDARDPHCTEAESPEDIARLWPQARHELLGFASHLRRSGSDLTAAQLHMAIRLAGMATGRGEGPEQGKAP